MTAGIPGASLFRITSHRCEMGAVRAVSLAAAFLVVPLRIWSIATTPDIIIYQLFPWWLQGLTAGAFLWLGVSAEWGRAGALRRAAGACVLVSVAVAVVSGAASLAAGAWVWWACMCGIMSWVYVATA